MKKLLVIIIIVVIILVCSVFVFRALTEAKPFNSLSASDISEVTISVNYRGTVLTLNENEINELVGILRKVVVYNQVHPDRFAAAGGQNLTFNVIKTDGNTISIRGFDTSIIVIDDMGYETKERPLGELHRLGSNLEWDSD